MIKEDILPYRSYLLRLWQVPKNGDRVNRASLQEVGTGEYRVFEDLDLLVRFLNSEIAVQQGEHKE
jgi:hypothetical protein